MTHDDVYRVCDDHQVVEERCRPDEQIHITAADALRPEINSQAPELFGAIGVERYEADGSSTPADAGNPVLKLVETPSF